MKVMLAKKFEGQNVKGWMMSEKLDGVRAVWTGKELRSRRGNKFNAPEWFTAQSPAGIILDGEIYISRGAFQAVAGIVRKKTLIDDDWQSVRYCVFDAPECKGGFEARLKFCSEIMKGCESAEVVKHEICKNKRHLHAVYTS